MRSTNDAWANKQRRPIKGDDHFCQSGRAQQARHFLLAMRKWLLKKVNKDKMKGRSWYMLLKILKVTNQRMVWIMSQASTVLKKMHKSMACIQQVRRLKGAYQTHRQDIRCVLEFLFEILLLYKPGYVHLPGSYSWPSPQFSLGHQLSIFFINTKLRSSLW